MTKKIFSYCFLVGALALLLCAGVLFGLQYRQTLDSTYATLRQEARCLAHGVEQNGAAFLEGLDAEPHITWMDAAGAIPTVSLRRTSDVSSCR